MKTYPGLCFAITRQLAISAWLICASLLAWPYDVRALSKGETDPPGKRPESIHEAVGKTRPNGPISVAIPVAYKYGLAGSNVTYCSPSIRATNSSDKAVKELIIGIDYVTVTGKSVGSTVTRYAHIKAGRQDTHFFYQIPVPDCAGLEGQVSIEYCVDSNGDDCSLQVKAIGFGTIPLRLKSR